MNFNVLSPREISSPSEITLIFSSATCSIDLIFSAHLGFVKTTALGYFSNNAGIDPE